MIRFCTIGTSEITTRFVEAVRVVEGARVEGVYSRDAARAADAATRLGGNAVSGDLDEVLASGAFDAVYIASPNAVHGEQVGRAIDLGLHVLVEKPAVTTAAEWSDLVIRAQSRGVVLLEAMRTEYDPGIAFVREILPRLGVLRSASLRYQSRSSRYDLVLAGERVNMFDPELAGGALNDLGVYCLHAMVSLFGVPEGIVAASVPVASGVDGAGQIIARYPGLVVGLEYSKITTTTLPSEIQGEDATLVVDHIASPRELTLVHRDGTAEKLSVDAPQHALTAEVERFVALVESGADAAVDQGRTYETLRLIEDVRAAAH